MKTNDFIWPVRLKIQTPHWTQDLFYHGTKAALKPGDLLEPDFHSNYGERKKDKFIYLTAILSHPPAAAGSGRSA